LVISSRSKGIDCCGRKAKAPGGALCRSDELLEVAYRVAGDRIEAALPPSKVARQKAVEASRRKQHRILSISEATKFEISQAFDYLQKKRFASASRQKVRCDGRSYEQIRNSARRLACFQSHGSALFQRGETQAICLATLAPADEAQELDGYTGGETSKRFILHYNFPPFSVGETGRTGSPGRREIGHGALAERSIAPVIPDVSDFPYAIRISSEIMESNGSTSMASVCAGVLALMDAGVPISKPVAGISCGLVTEFSGDFELRCHGHHRQRGLFGDMDFNFAAQKQVSPAST
jgi:polyribonucleotide nucleotidyltransferase